MPHVSCIVYLVPCILHLLIRMDDHQRQTLTAIFLQFASLGHASLEKMRACCEVRIVKKGDAFAAPGRADAYEYFLLDGVACRYIFDERGEIVVTGFYLPRAVVTPHFARTVNGKSLYHFEALTDAVLARMPVKMLDALRHTYPDIRAFGASVVESELIKTLHSEVAYRSLTAKDRLVAFRGQYPHLENLIPHSYIASFLGITPVSFSRLRNELARKEKKKE